MFPRLGRYSGRAGDREVVLNTWPLSETGQVLFHNELMQCCGLSLRDVSQKRASLHEPAPLEVSRVPAQAVASGGGNVADAADAAAVDPVLPQAASHGGCAGGSAPLRGGMAPATPPAGLQSILQGN